MPTKRKNTARPANRAADNKPAKKRTAQTTKTASRSAATLGQMKEPKSPMPAQHQRKPGLESKLKPRPRYQAPFYKGSGKLAGKVALITGGDSGIGRAVAVLFAREGADVAITHLPQEASDARETVAAIEAEGSEALAIAGDITQPRFPANAVKKTLATMGKLDILVNNAAYQQHQSGLEELSEEQWDRTFKTNIYGYFRMAKAVLPHLTKGSAIINTGSITGLDGSKELLDYSATKGAILTFTRSLAHNLIDKGIRVNAVAPGPIWTPLIVGSFDKKKVATFGSDVPMKRAGEPAEVAPCYLFLASADSSYITGQVMHPNGGEIING